MDDRLEKGTWRSFIGSAPTLHRCRQGLNEHSSPSDAEHYAKTAQSLVTGLGALFALNLLFATANAQIIQFPGGAPPVISRPSIKSTDEKGRPLTVADAVTGSEFVPLYNSSGHLVSLRSTRGHNAFDIRAITYLPNGNITSVSFGNRYQLIFTYRNDGTQMIIDSFGGTMIRKQSPAGHYSMQSIADSTGFLGSSLSLVAALLSLFGKMPGI
jgi:hypothetical protein